MQKDTIKICRKISDKELSKLEKAAQKAHCKEFSFDIRDKETIVVVPKEKVPQVFKYLVDAGVV